MLKKIATSILFCLIYSVAWADPLSGEKSLYLVEVDGTEHLAAQVRFQANGDKSSYSIEWNDEVFGEHFLSMRPFKCLEGSIKYWCRVAYPYPIKRTVSATDLTDLEYDTLFIWKGATEYGINMWNGVYYRLSIEGDLLVGKINEMDMDKLSAPPEEGILRPVEDDDLEPGEPESHWLPKLIVR